MPQLQSDAAVIYVEACNREHAECALELVQALEGGDKEVVLADRAVPLNDVDLCCVAEALRSAAHPLRVLNLEGNAFGLAGLQALLEAVERNPGIVRELRLGRNKLRDQAAVVVGHTLSRDGCGLKVLDLSENDITKLGVIPIAGALASESCDIVELSFHNNKIEADAATYLGQAIRHTGKLRHLHLGYNAIRDTGAAQLAQCIPMTVSLSTLDLTANRIGPSGGKELARALLSPSCNIQRLNLRHNLFDSDTIEMFAEVLRQNTSLIQLFLGFMNPKPDSAVTVLSALRENRSLLLLDIYGWKIHPEDAWGILESIQKTNTTVAAIVTDACQSIAKRVDEGNDERDERGQHPIYVGPDDRDAYIATKSLRRFSRAQSRRQSRASSRGGMSSRTGSPPRRRPTENFNFNKETETVHSRHSSRAAQEAPYQLPQKSATNVPREENQSYRRTTSVPRDPAIIAAGDDNLPSPLDSHHALDSSRREMELLRRELAEQKQIQRSLEARVAALEKRKECTCCGNTSIPVEGSPFARVASRSRNGRDIYDGVNNEQNYQETPKRGRSNRHGFKSQDRIFDSCVSARGGVANNIESIERSRSAEPIPYDLNHSAFLGSHTKPTVNSTSVPTTANSGSRTASYRAGSVGGPAEFPHLSVSQTERSEPPAEPVELPKEKKPAEAILQTSTNKTENYQPRLGPAPSKDNNPPRRKGSVQAG